MKKLGKILLILVALLVIALVIISFSLGSIIKKGIETAGPEVAKVKMTITGASLSLLGGSGTVKGLFIGNPEGYKTESAVKVGTTHLSVSPGSLMSDKVVIRSIQIDGPELTLEGDL
ncbi:MAG: AsmA family protein, partial [Tepidisphaeraceae bacterium]